MRVYGPPPVPPGVVPKMQAKVLRGKRKDEVVTVIQYCNDWANTQEAGVLKLSSLHFFGASWRAVLADYEQDRLQDVSNRLGEMFTRFYDLDHFYKSGRFKKLRVQ